MLVYIEKLLQRIAIIIQAYCYTSPSPIAVCHQLLPIICMVDMLLNVASYAALLQHST